MHHLGAPLDVLMFWFRNLTKLSRVLQCGQAVGHARISTTGVPEGDPLSVCAMVALSTVFHFKLISPSLHAFCYADNWSWISPSKRETWLALVKTLNLVHNLRMKIDFSKSWGWGTTREMRQFWKEASMIRMSDDFCFVVKNDAKELGSLMNYTKRVRLGDLTTKISSACQRCNRLAKIDLPVFDKGAKIQSTIWPHAFWGSESQVVGKAHFTNLGRAAITALVGDDKIANPFLAMHYVAPSLQDPLLFVISSLLTALRRLWHYSFDLAEEIWHHTYTKFQTWPSECFALIFKPSWVETRCLQGPGGLFVSIKLNVTHPVKFVVL